MNHDRSPHEMHRSPCPDPDRPPRHQWVPNRFRASRPEPSQPNSRLWRNPNRGVFLLILFIPFVLPGCGLGARKTRIVLITLDTLRYDSLHGVPPRPSAMPKILAKAKKSGLQFDQFYSSTSSTQPTHATLFTGLHPWETGVPRNGCVLDEAHETLAEILGQRGFSTAAVVGSFALHEKFGWSQGFDSFDDTFSEKMRIGQWEGEEIPEENFYSRCADVSTRALLALDTMESDRQFLWVHYYDPHSPYGDATLEPIRLHDLLKLAEANHPELGRVVRQARNLYDLDTRALDSSLAQLIERLDARGVEEGFETHVVLTSDHGESFGEDGSLGHGKRLSREQIQVPLVIFSPGIEAGQRDDSAGSIDLFSTLLGLAEIDGVESHGRDLLASETRNPTPTVGMRRTFSEPYLDARTDGTSATVTGSSFFQVRNGRIYSGNGELVVVEDRPDQVAPEEIAKPLRTLFRSFEAVLNRESISEVLDEKTLQTLRNMGYFR